MTPEQSYQVLSEATQPQAAGRITREGYVQIQQALEVYAGVIRELAEARRSVDPEKP